MKGSFTILLVIMTIFNSIAQRIDIHSTTSVRFTAYKPGLDSLRYNSTGFIFFTGKKYYFITNDHSVGGIKFVEDYRSRYKRFPSSDSMPTHGRIQFLDFKYNSRGSNFQFELFDKNKKPIWISFFENEENKLTRLDVAAFELKGFDREKNFTYVLSDSDFVESLSLSVSDELFVVGYPAGVPTYFPIWKRGTIASEPNLLEYGHSWFYIDASTRKGMSGSPVYFRSNYVTISSGSSVKSTLLPTQKTYLVGIYFAQDYESEVGVVIRFDKILAKLKLLDNQ